jgi:NADH kinase
MDGRASHVLQPGESVNVHASPFPVPCINRSSIGEHLADRKTPSALPGVEESAETGDLLGPEGAPPGPEDDWVRDINNLLQYNATFRSKALLRHTRP